jgi:hypothetical protein
MNKNNFNLDEDQIKNLEKFSQSYMTFMSKTINFFSRIVDFFSRNPKLIYLIITLFITYQIVSYLTSIEPKGRYEIKASNNIIYQTNQFEIKNNCVFFKKTSNNQDVIVCGEYVIHKN